MGTGRKRELARPAGAKLQGKYLQLQFTVDDEGAFTTPWTATMTYGRSRGDWAEAVCAENIQWYSGKEAAVPSADKPDFLSKAGAAVKTN